MIPQHGSCRSDARLQHQTGIRVDRHETRPGATLCAASFTAASAKHRGHYRFSFQDVVLLRTAKGMTDASISVRQTNRALEKLQTELKSVSSLSAVRIYAHGNAVVVREDDQVWEVESGQMTIDFDIQSLVWMWHKSPATMLAVVSRQKS